MSKVSVIIPSRNERFLVKTVTDLLQKAAGDIEVIVVLDERPPDEPFPNDKRLTVLQQPTPKGMRAGNNWAASVATGDYLMKTDGHCLFAEGFDVAMAADCDDDWLAIPRRKRLNAEQWVVEDPERTPLDYHYLDCPTTNPGGYQFHGVIWLRRSIERYGKPEFLIDDTMSFQGSCWFMSRKHWDRLGGMSEVGYGSFCQEPQELGNKTWLGGGRVVVNKKTWYAHLHKGKQYGRGYRQDKGELRRGHEWSARYWMGNKWPDRIRDFEWLVDKFWPVPEWPDNWRELEALVKHE